MHITGTEIRFSYNTETGMINNQPDMASSSKVEEVVSNQCINAWKKVDNRKFLSTEIVANFSGYAFRGDSRSPECIFKEGFVKKESSTDEIFKRNLQTMEVRFVDVEPNKHFVSEKQLQVNPGSAVCLTENPYFAAHFPHTELANATFVYMVLVTKGVSLKETVGILDSDDCHTSLSRSMGEIMTPRILAEHVVCAWPVARERLFLRSSYNAVVSFKPSFKHLIINPFVDKCVSRHPMPLNELQAVEKEKKIVIRTRSEMMTVMEDDLQLPCDNYDSDDSLYS